MTKSGMTTYCRRSFLKTLGVGAALLPTLEPEWAHADNHAPRRLLVISKNNGAHLPDWVRTPPSGGQAPLDGYPFPESWKPLERRKQDIVILGGVQHTTMQRVPNYNGHGSASHTLTGIAGGPESTGVTLGGGPSLDQVIAQRIAEEVTLPHRIVNMAVSPGATLSWLERDRAAGVDWDINRLWDRFFGVAPPESGEGDRIRRERRSVLDYVSGELGRFRRRLGTEDQKRVDHHLDVVRDLERRLGAGVAACVPPDRAPDGFADYLAENKKRQHELLVGIASSVIACDVSRVVTLHLGIGDFPMLFLGEEFRLGSPDSPDANYVASYHDITHHQYQRAFVPLKIRADQWWLETTLLAAIDRLDAVPEGYGTVLDNTLILHGDDMGNGAVHTQDELPWIIAGRAGGAIRTGRYLHPGRHVPHNHVLVAIAQALGHAVDTFGEPEFRGPYPGLLG